MSRDDEFEVAFDPPRRRPPKQLELPLEPEPIQAKTPWRVRDVCADFRLLDGDVELVLGYRADGTPDWLIVCTSALTRFLKTHPQWLRGILES